MGELAATVTGKASAGSYGRDFRLYVAGQAVSVVGDRVALIALVFLVVRLSHSYAPALALFYVARLLPTLMGGFLVGVVVDHTNRQRLMVSCDLGRAVLLAAVPALSTLTLWALYPMVVVLFGLTLLFNTAARAALPDVVPEEHMTAANAVLQAIDTSADVAYALGGALIVFLKLQIPFYIDAATFLFSATTISFMRIPVGSKEALPRLGALIRDIRDGVSYLFGQPFLKWTTLVFSIAPLAGGAIFVLTPLYASRGLAHSPGLIGPLRGGAFRFSMLEVGLGLGALAGSIVASRLARRWPRGQLFGAGIVGYGAASALLSGVTNVYVAMAVTALGGFFNMLFVIPGMTLLQTLTPSELRGRVVAGRMTIINTSLALGSAIGGGLLLAIPYSTAWLLLGALIAASSLFVWLHPQVRGQV